MCHKIFIYIISETNIFVLLMIQFYKKTLSQFLQNGQLGIAKTKIPAKENKYWPRMKSDIENIGSTCEVCREYQKKQKHEIFIPHKISEAPWIKISAVTFLPKII